MVVPRCDLPAEFAHRFRCTQKIGIYLTDLFKRNG
jgi:hypothetical protein